MVQMNTNFFVVVKFTFSKQLLNSEIYIITKIVTKLFSHFYNVKEHFLYIKKIIDKKNWQQDQEFTSKVFYQIMFFFKHV